MDLFKSMDLGRFRDVSVRSRDDVVEKAIAAIGDVHDWKAGKYVKTSVGWKRVSAADPEGKAPEEVMSPETLQENEELESDSPGKVAYDLLRMNHEDEIAFLRGADKKMQITSAFPHKKNEQYFDSLTDALIRSKPISDGRIMSTAVERANVLAEYGDIRPKKIHIKTAIALKKRVKDDAVPKEWGAKPVRNYERMTKSAYNRMVILANSIDDPNEVARQGKALKKLGLPKAEMIFNNRAALLLAEKKRQGDK